MSSPSSALFLWMQRSVTLHNHPASEHRESSNHPRPILLICMSFMCSSMPCPQPALQLLLPFCLFVCLQINSSQVVSTTALPFKKITQAAKQQFNQGTNQQLLVSSIPTSIKVSVFQCSRTACFAFTPKLPPGKLHPIPTIATSSAVSISISWAAQDRSTVSPRQQLCIYH